jgi:hypothetical protein
MIGHHRRAYLNIRHLNDYKWTFHVVIRLCVRVWEWARGQTNINKQQQKTRNYAHSEGTLNDAHLKVIALQTRVGPAATGLARVGKQQHVPQFKHT